MSHRIIRGLLWARPCDKPTFIPVARSRGAKAQGRRYERLVAKALGPSAQHGQWFEFADSNGLGWCQPDLLLPRGAQIIVIECKNTWTPEGHSQAQLLYKPVVERAIGKQALCIQVCKNLRPAEGMNVFGDLLEAVWAAQDNMPNVVFHWIGKGQIWSPKLGRSALSTGATPQGLGR